jgi:hypothetical protein
MKPHRLIFVNGPPRSGKDYAGVVLAQREDLGLTNMAKLSAILKERTHALYMLFDQGGKPLRHDFFEHTKDDPLPEFYGISPREAYIAVSERWMKPTHGQGVLGEWLVAKLRKHEAHMRARWTHIITDSGFTEEAAALVEAYGKDNCSLVRITREGYDFSSDSRSYIELDVPTFDVDNDGGPLFAAELKLISL